MELPLSTLFILISTISLSSTSLCFAAERNTDTTPDLVRSSCSHASYPSLCLQTLASYAGPAKTPSDVALAAVTVSLSCAQKTTDFLKSLAKIRVGQRKRERGALSDCVEQLTDAVDELHKTMSELQHLRSRTFQWQMSNAETWVSAALTNDDTCLDGFRGVDGKVKEDVRKKITNVAKVTSNALYLITLLDESRGKGGVIHP